MFQPCTLLVFLSFDTNIILDFSEITIYPKSDNLNTLYSLHIRFQKQMLVFVQYNNTIFCLEEEEEWTHVPTRENSLEDSADRPSGLHW